MPDPYSVLRQYFGYSSFRPGQEKIIRSILKGRDTLCIMPTGAGKSLCYQVPALMMPGITLVISPLISLMQDQVRILNIHGIHAAYLNSSLSKEQLSLASRKVMHGDYKLLYLSPERLGTPSFQALCQKLSISLLCVDEAHCISKWGAEFRPAYRLIGEFADHLSHRPGVCAFTATAAGSVRDDIINGLHLRNPICLTTGFDRPNLFFEVDEPKDKFEYLTMLLRKHRGECGVVYCLTRRTVEMLTRRLLRLGIPAAAYHAGLTQEERQKNLTLWLSDEVSVMVATNAFGMGIDKPDVRIVIHYNMPGDMEAYYQEAGRAGRDGLPSDCILLTGYTDVVINEFFMRQSENENPDGQKKNLAAKRAALHEMMRYVSGKTCLRAFILNYFGEHAPSFCGKCSVCIAPKEEISQKKQRPEEDPELYRHLRALRLRISKEKKKLPSAIFGDPVLHEMATAVPTGWFDLLCISGIKPLCLLRYGSPFLSELRLWKETHKEYHSVKATER